MHVRSLEISGFTKHKATKITFPKRGVVLIVGPNGAGKSSIPEAVSEVIWHKPLRKKTGRKSLRLWNGQGEISIETDRVVVHRASTGKVTWSPVGNSDAVDFESKTKSQEDLEAIVGEHQLWSRSKVFSSADASHFTLARDSERKRLLEMILRLDRFDSAHKDCLADLRKAEASVSEHERRIDVLVERISGLKEQLDEIPKTPDAPVIDGVKLSTRHIDDVTKRLRDRVAQARVEAQAVKELQEEEREFSAAHGRSEEALTQAKRAAKQARAGKCQACGAPVTKERQKQATAKLMEARAEHSRTEDLLREARLAVARADERAESAQGAAETARGLLRDVEAWAGATEAGKRRRHALGLKLEEAEEERDTVSLECERARTLAGELRAAAQALGLTGIRAHMLGNALAGIELVANAWLARFAMGQEDPISISLEPYSEKPGGGVKDAISLTLHGVAEPDDGGEGGQDYGATSGGERRRIDIALMLGLAEVEAGASGFDSGTLWFDEVFDWLDEEGREAAFEIIAELAESACVVVITHNRQLITGLLPVAKAVWQVEGGRVYDRKDGDTVVAGAADRKPRVGKAKLPRTDSESDAVRDLRRTRRTC